MTVKSKRGRRRYLAFKTSEDMTRESMVRRIPGGKRFNVIQCAEGKAVVRCSPLEIEDCIDAVAFVDPDSRILTVSGTIRTLRDRYPDLKKNAPPKPSKTTIPAHAQGEGKTR